MADGVFNISRGTLKAAHDRVVTNDPANSALVVVLLKLTEADDTLNNYDDLATLLAAAGNTEADFTNYARKVLTDADLTAATVDDSGNQITCLLPQLLYSSAGGATNNALVKALVCYDPDTTGGTDANIIPLTHHDITKTTDGGNYPLQFFPHWYNEAE